MLIAVLLTSNATYAYDFESGGVLYNITSASEPYTVAVTYKFDGEVVHNYYKGSVTIPEKVTYNGITYSVTEIDAAFAGSYYLTSVTIPASILKIGGEIQGFASFSDCRSLISINVSDDNPNFCSIDGVLYSKDKKTLIAYPGAKGNEYTIPEGTILIDEFAFSCVGLKSITIPESVTTIGKYAFDGCSGLTGVYISDIEAWCKIDFRNSDANPLYYAKNLYLNNEKVTNLVIPNTVNEIKDYTFKDCTGIASVTVGNSVKKIGRDAFLNCTGLTSVTIGNSVTSIGDAAFEGCSNLTEILSLAKTPAYAESETFYAINSNVILYVPEGSKEAYSTAQAWSDFPTIVEIPTNTLSMPPVELYKGKTVTVPVSLSNLDKFTAFQCDLTLPDGVTCSKVTLSDRASDHTITKSQYSDNVVRIASISFTSSPFSGNDGILFNIELTETESFAEGQYEISLKNIKFSTIDAEEYNLPETTATVTMKTYIKGDANGDGSITITDAVAVVNYVMGNIPASFVFDAADINESGDISITDAVGTVNLLLSQSVSTTSISTQNNTKSIISPKAEITTDGNSLYMQDFTVIPGTENTVYLYMDNSTDYTAFSTDIHFPQGITVKSKKLCSERVSDHMMSSSTPAENVLRLAALSFTNSPFTGVSGDPIVELTISVDENFTGGTITINNAELSTASMDYCRPDKTTADITLDITDGVNDITEDSATSVEYYDLQGVRVENPEKGVYIKRQGGKTSKVVM